MTMFLETVKSEGLAHLSYVLGHGRQAAVVDPRRDCRDYVDIAHAHGCRITHIFETHKNEDYVSGAPELARLTGADIYHGAGLDWGFGETVEDGDLFQIGDLLLKVLATPGHTLDSISIAVYDTGFSRDEAVAVFTGDCLFIGDTGRTDFYPERAAEVAGLLYDSIFATLLPLGDQTILCPAHGAGSVCGAHMAAREFSTLGFERAHNTSLQKTERDDFVAMKLAERHNLPPYFKKMEEYNQHGNAPILCAVPQPPPEGVDEFDARIRDGMLVLDVRPAEAIAGTLIPGSLAIPVEMLSAYGGYFLSYGRDLGLVAPDLDAVDRAVRQLVRMGFDNVTGFLADGLHAWEVSGREYETIPAVHVAELVRRIEAGEDFVLLDVRKPGEYESAHLPGAQHIFLGDLLSRLDEIPKDKLITTFCGSGQRAIIGASLLKQAGYARVEVALGSMMACASFGCPIER